MTRWLRRIGGVTLVTGAMVLAAGTPAAAQQGTVPINEGNVPTTAEEFETHECDDPFDDLAEDEDGWHFVLPPASGDAFVSLTLTFDTPDGEETVVIDSTDPDNPSTGDGWSGYIDPDLGTGSMHAWLVTEAGWTLETGEAEVENAEDDGFFVLSHTCPGTPPSPSPSPTPTPAPSPSMSPAPSPSPSMSPPASPAPSPPAKPGLPDTGSALGSVVLLGTALVAAGGVLLLMLHRRRTGSDAAGS